MKSTRFVGGLLILLILLGAAVAVPLAALGLDAPISDIIEHSFGDGTPTDGYEAPSARAGSSIILTFPLSIEFGYAYTTGEAPDQKIVYSNLDFYDSLIWSESEQKMVNNTEFLNMFDSLTVAVDNSDSETFPLDITRREVFRVVNGGMMQGLVSLGGLKVKSGMPEGNYEVPLLIEYVDKWGETGTIDEVSVTIYVKPEKTSSGGGYSGGGGGGGTEAAQPQAKLMVASIRTIPELPMAGQEFQIVLMLRNTSDSKYLQNITMTWSAEEDLIMPVAGTNRVYIPRIEQGADYEVVLDVKGMPEVTDKPVKLELSFEFEDSKVNQLTDAQTLMVNVDQPLRVKVDDPVMPAVAPAEGDTAELKVTVYNMGRPTLYNVAARVVTDNKDLVTVSSGYGGILETNTNKELTLEVIPLTSGDYTGIVEVSYENADGEVFTVEKDMSFYASKIEPYDDDDMWGNQIVEPEEPEEPTATLIMRALPWWLYAAIGGILLLLILSMGIGARRKRRRDYEDDEMD